MHVAVLGGGLQGACVAMELASRGISVDLYDENERFLTQASAQNEGKIHLGYVYAKDRSLHTARTLVRGAVAFAPLLRRWLGSALETIPVSAPFLYVVHTRSMLADFEVESHLRASHALALEENADLAVDYFGGDFRMAPARVPEREWEAAFDRRSVTAVFRTAEISIDPEALAALVRARLESDPKIHCFPGARVHGAVPESRESHGVTVAFEIAGHPASARYDHVVNTLWDGRLVVDRTAGLEPPRPWLYRVKHFVRLRAPGIAAGLPSATVVLGPFGDVVSYGNGNLDLSWYPVGMRGSAATIHPPAWARVLDAAAARTVRDVIVEGLGEIVPALSSLPRSVVESGIVKGGIIVAWGETDIDDPASVLHERYAIGPQTSGRYHTVDTGKLTMAPFFAKVVADRIRQVA